MGSMIGTRKGSNSSSNTAEWSPSEELKPTSVEMHLHHLLQKELAIKNGKLLVPTTTAVTGMKSAKNSYSLVSLSHGYQGWLSDPSLKTIVVSEIMQHGFVLALHLAFATDNEFTISPDDIWLVIAQGFSQHVNKNPEKYRKKLVNFDGTKTITIKRDNYGPDERQNPWNDCFPEFAEKISKFIGERNVALVSDEFTTTTVTSTMAMQVVLMDMVKHYFRYDVHSACGIPKFHIKGSKEDWSKMLEKVQVFREFDLDWWVNRLEKVLKKMLNIVSGKKEKTWLNSFYKYSSVSCRDRFNGHVLKLFPYVENQAGDFVENKPKEHRRGLKMSSLPSGQTDVPFIWKYLEKENKMSFRTFTVPVVEGESIAVKPVIQVVEDNDDDKLLKFPNFL